MGLSTQDLYIQKEDNELYKIPKFRVNWANITKKCMVSGHFGQVSGNPYIC